MRVVFLSRSLLLVSILLLVLPIRLCRRIGRRIDTFTADDVSARLRGMLKDFWLRQGKGGAFTLPCSYTQLAALLNVGRASLYRALEQLEREGLFTREGRVFRLTESAFQIEDQ